MRRLRIPLILVLLLGAGFCFRKVGGTLGEYRQAEQSYDALSSSAVTTPAPVQSPSQAPQTSPLPIPSRDVAAQPSPAPLSVDFEALWEVCEDIVAWIYCQDTAVSYPIVQSADNDRYLRRLPNGRYNIGGSIFMDYRNDPAFGDWNTVIYGHNMTNGTMFGVLPKYRSQGFFEAHPVWYILTPEKTYRLELMGGYTTPSDSVAYSRPESREERDKLAAETLDRSDFFSDPELGPEDRLVTLSTCVYDYENARYVLVGILREVQ